MKKVLILTLLILALIPLVSAQEENKICVYFFYGQGCPHCGRAEPVLYELERKYDNLKIHRFEIYNNRDNLILLTQYFDRYDIPPEHRGVPVAFLADTYLVGGKPIVDNLELEIKAFEGPVPCPSLEEDGATGEVGGKSPMEKISSVSLLVVAGAALVDSINPCAIAVLLILMAALLSAGDKKRALKAGLAFTVSIYIVYFLFGVGLFSALQFTGLSYWFYKVIGGMAIVIGLLNIKDYFWYGGGGFVMEIPRRWRPKLKMMLKSVTSPLGAFLMGFAVCLFELPCTGGPYIFILGLLAEKTTRLFAIPILLFYNLLFILPLIIISISIYFGLSNVEKATEWKERNIRKLHLVAGIVMLALGLIVVSGLV